MLGHPARLSVPLALVALLVAPRAATATSLTIQTLDQVADPLTSEVVSTQSNDVTVPFVPGLIEPDFLEGESSSNEGVASTASSAFADFGILDVSAQQSIMMSDAADLREALSMALASFTDTLTITDGGTTGMGAFQVRYRIEGDTFATGSGSFSSTLVIDGSGNVAPAPGNVPGEFLSPPIAFEYGVPFDIFVELSVAAAGDAFGSASSISRAFTWLGMEKLSDTDAVESTTGVNYLVPVIVAQKLGEYLRILAFDQFDFTRWIRGQSPADRCPVGFGNLNDIATFERAGDRHDSHRQKAVATVLDGIRRTGIDSDAAPVFGTARQYPAFSTFTA